VRRGGKREKKGIDPVIPMRKELVNRMRKLSKEEGEEGIDVRAGVYLLKAHESVIGHLLREYGSGGWGGVIEDL